MRATDPRPPRAGPLGPPGAPLDTIPRPALTARLSGAERVVLVVAPPGYGKTEITRQWSEGEEHPVGWVPVDLVDRAPVRFWGHLLRALAEVVGSEDQEPALLLAERGPADPIFLDAVIAQVEAAGRPGTLVIDDAWRLHGTAAHDGLALLVDRIGHLVRLVVLDRSDPPFPTALWRSRGWVAEVRADDLRFGDEEAVLAATELTGLTLGPDVVEELNARAEGWPLGLHLALVSIAGDPGEGSVARSVARSDRLLVDYLVSEVLEGLPTDVRDVALSLSVLPWFDSALCAELLGADAVPAADELRRRRLFLTSVEDGSDDAVRFHPLFRTLLEHELGWRDPARRTELHRQAAALWRARGDLTSAYHHLISIGDVAAATDLVLPVALALVDHGAMPTLVEYMRRLPDDLHVRDARQAFDLAQAWALAGVEDEAVRWRTVGEHHLADADPADRVHGRATAALVDLLQGSTDTAREHVRVVERSWTAGRDAGVTERLFPLVAARAALLAGHVDEAATWVERSEAEGVLDQPPALRRVMAAALAAWLHYEQGDLARARVEADTAVEHAESSAIRPHLGTFDAFVVQVRCRIGSGDLREADELLEQVRADAARLGWTLPRVRAGLLAARVARVRSGAPSSLDVIRELRASLGPCPDPVDLWLAAAEASALVGLGRLDEARRRVERLDDRPRHRLLRAGLAVADGAAADVEELLADRHLWGTSLRLEADLLAALAGLDTGGDDGGLDTVLAAGHETGWVSPFLDRAEALEARLGLARIHQLHPALARALRFRQPSERRPPEPVEALTPRELTLLELLPTHLSYAEIGDRLYLSVNTIKSNLKAIYRKLDVTSRTDAVEAAWSLGLLDPDASPPGPRPR